MDASTLLTSTVERLRRHEGQYAEICRQNPEITYSWLTKLAHGQITDPKITSLQQLIEALNDFEGERPQQGLVAESTPDAPRVEPFEEAP